jgi:hypothetical protein
MNGDLLQHIQSLQFSDRRRAEALTLAFIRDTFPLDAVAVELRPLAVSLNSFNGFLRLSDGKRLFFKTHTETDTVIGEYYRANMLAEAGYPVIKPLYSSTEIGKQLLIYEVIDDPSVFDLAWDIEIGKNNSLPELAHAQQAADDQLLAAYVRTLQWQSADAAEQAAVHQLFYHRLAGGRLVRFYGVLDTNQNQAITIILPGATHSMYEVCRAHWVINGQVYEKTLSDLIGQSIQLLNPAQAGPAVAGHGDAHNGNVFFRRQNNSLLYFDPAFAGLHHPLLDITKPLFHNVFAMWMYFPQVKREVTKIELQIDGDLWHVEHNYTLHPVREMFFRSKVERVLLPLLIELKRRGWLRDDWRDYLKAALFCCPLLTMNLADSTKFPPEISLLGLTMAVEMGSQVQQSLIDRTLDDIARSL